MEAKSIDNKTYQLTDEGNSLGELVYRDILFLKAEINLSDSHIYQIKPVGIFGTSVTVTKDAKEVANLKMNWRGQIVMSFDDGQEFVLKAKGIFHNKYVVENSDAEKMLEFHPKFNWSKFIYQFEISYDTKPRDHLFVLLGLYAANYLIASMSGASSGMG